MVNYRDEILDLVEEGVVDVDTVLMEVLKYIDMDTAKGVYNQINEYMLEGC